MEDHGTSSNLLHAAFLGDSDAVRRLLAAGMDVNTVDARGWTPLLRAVERGHIPLTRLLIEEYGAAVGAADRRGRTALQWAARHGLSDSVRLLLEKGADPERPDGHGTTPLELAVVHKHTGVLKLLLEAGAERSERSTTPEDRWAKARRPYLWRRTLSLAIRLGRLRAVEALLDAGVGTGMQHWGVIPENKGEVWVTDDFFPLAEAATYGRYAISELLLGRGADPQARSRGRRTALTEAVRRGDTGMERLLREHGASWGLEDAVVVDDLGAVRTFLDPHSGSDVEVRRSNGATLLTWVCQRGRLAMARLLVERGGADLHPASNGFSSPMGSAASSGSLELVQYLIERGASTNTSLPVLSRAAGSGHEEVVRWLLAHHGLGPDEGASALVAAAEAGYLNIVQLLLDAGVDPNRASPSHYQRTALVYAAWRAHKDIVRLLLDRGAQISAEVIGMAASVGRRRTLALILGEKDGAAVMVPEERNKALMSALYAYRSHPDTGILIVESMLSAGADPNQQSSSGKSLLMIAAERGDPAAITALLRHGVDSHATDKTGKAAVEWALANERHGAEIVKMLRAPSVIRE